MVYLFIKNYTARGLGRVITSANRSIDWKADKGDFELNLIELSFSIAHHFTKECLCFVALNEEMKELMKKIMIYTIAL